MEFRYEELVRYNLPLLTHEEQKKIRRTNLLIAGCGMGSVLAEAAVRIGFEHLILVDGDKVELPNINRQAYQFDDVGKYKVEALADRLKRINPECKITALAEFLNAGNAESIIAAADVIVDFIDFIAIGDVITLHKEARRQGKSVISPLGVGWGGAVIIITADSMGIEELFKSYTGTNLKELAQDNPAEILDRFQNKTQAIPDYLLRLAPRLLGQGFKAGMAEYPQPSVTALQCSVLAAVSVLKVALGLPTKVAPDVIHFDPWLASDPSN